MFFAISISSWTSFLIVHFAKSFIKGPEMFWIAGGLTLVNILLLYLLDEREMISK
jgi:hypothetical protein